MFAAICLAPFGICFGEAGPEAVSAASESEKLFLDRLMAAESGGRLKAKNPASSAYGPFQFLSDTFLEVVRRKLPALAVGKSNAQILNLRANADVARSAALFYTRENARFLAARGAPVTEAALRLAFFVGPSGALKVMTAKPEEPVANILGAPALQANRVLRTMTAATLIEKSSRDVKGLGPLLAAPPQANPAETMAALAPIAKQGREAAGVIPLSGAAPLAAASQPGSGRETVAALGEIRRPGREVAAAGSLENSASLAAPPLARARPKLGVRCNLNLASCRKWLALAQRRMGARPMVLAPEWTD